MFLATYMNGGFFHFVLQKSFAQPVHHIAISLHSLVNDDLLCLPDSVALEVQVQVSHRFGVQ